VTDSVTFSVPQQLRYLQKKDWFELTNVINVSVYNPPN